MSKLLTPLRQLGRSKLWPVAALLVAVVVGAPVVLAKEPEPVAQAAASAPLSAPANLPALPILSDNDVARHLGASGNPFRPKGTPAAPPAAVTAPSTGTAAPDLGSSSSSPAPSLSSTIDSLGPALDDVAPPSVSETIPSATPAPTATPKPALAYGKIDVAFDKERIVLSRLGALPSVSDPSAIYLGLLEDRKTAVFLVDASLKVEGDGRCDPTPEDCQRLYLQEDDTVFLTPRETAATDGDAAAATPSPTDAEPLVLPDAGTDQAPAPADEELAPAAGTSQAESTGTDTGAQADAGHQLDLVEIGMAGAPKAAASRAGASRIKRVLRANAARSQGLRVDARTGLLRRVR